MKDGAIICNRATSTSRFDIPALRDLATETREARNFVEDSHSRRSSPVSAAEGRLVNISAAEDTRRS